MNRDLSVSRDAKGGVLLLLALLAALLVLTVGCAPKVTRIDPAAVTDLSGRWNDTDSRLVANELIRSSLGDGWLRRYSDTHAGETPAVIVGGFENRTREHIAVNTFLNDLERAYVNSGAVRVVADRTERTEVRDERADQQENARAETRNHMAQELGARYMLQGSIEAVEDAQGRERVVFYQVDATLVDIASNQKVWTGQHKIKKYIERPRVRL